MACMKVDPTVSPHPATDDSCKKETGKSLQEWFAVLDERGGPSVGRRDIGNFLYFECKNGEWWSPTIYTEYERARGVTDKDGRPTGYSICATKQVKAPVNDVYKAFTDAGTLDKWFGPGTKLDLRDGGSMENADGNKMDIVRVRENKDLRMIWHGSEPSPVEAMLKGSGGKTMITVNHTRIQDRAEADGIRAAWTEALGKLKTLLEDG